MITAVLGNRHSLPTGEFESAVGGFVEDVQSNSMLRLKLDRAEELALQGQAHMLWLRTEEASCR